MLFKIPLLKGGDAIECSQNNRATNGYYLLNYRNYTSIQPLAPQLVKGLSQPLSSIFWLKSYPKGEKMSRLILLIVALLVLGNSLAVYELKNELTELKMYLKDKNESTSKRSQRRLVRVYRLDSLYSCDYLSLSRNTLTNGASTTPAPPK